MVLQFSECKSLHTKLNKRISFAKFNYIKKSQFTVIYTLLFYFGLKLKLVRGD